jgi:hypothetical protein
MQAYNYDIERAGGAPAPGEAGVLKDGMIYDQRLFHYSYAAAAAADAHFLAFRGLQRLNIVHLQNKLGRLKSTVWKDMAASDDILAKLEITLHQYSELNKCQMLSYVVYNLFSKCDPGL